MASASSGRRTLLIAVASKHGSTAEIAERIQRRLLQDLSADQWQIATEDCDDISSIEGYDAVVFGSAVYLGRWLKPATQLLSAANISPPQGLWLFSSGPIGADALSNEVLPILQHTNPELKLVEHVMFAGALDTQKLNLWEKVVTSLMRIKSGDFRNWTDIDDWASRIARQLALPNPLATNPTNTKEVHT